MSDAPLRPRLTSAGARQIDQACDRFEAAWKAGGRPRPEDYLGAAGEPERSALLRQLLLLDWEFRRRAGEEPRPADYRTRFPGDLALIDDVGREMSRSADDTPWPAGREPIRPEEALFGPVRYDLLEEVGHGGAGVVFRGRDRLLGRELAVKVLRADHRDTPEVRRRFIEEAKVGSRLQHPAIVPVYDLGWSDDRRPYFTMKLVEGRTLAALLKDRTDPSQDLTRLLGIFEQVCQAMAYAHARGVVHRDLKPANVMVGAFGEVQVMDWGFAKVLGGDEAPAESSPERGATDSAQTPPVSGRPGASQSGVVMGTPAYMPPEQAQGKAALIDPRADVFALGAILCEVLTGRPPYGGRTIEEVCLRAAEGDLADAHARLDACGAAEALRALARRCLTAEREARPPDAGAVARDLAAYLASAQERLRQAQLERAAAEARVEEARAKAKAERRARRLTAALATAAVVLLAAAGAGWWWYDRVQQARALQTAAADGKVEAALAEADDRMAGNDWSGADAAATRARELLESGASDRWKRRADELRDDLGVVGRIEDVRRLAAEYDPTTQSFPYAEALARYAEVFGSYGIHPGAEPAEAEARVRGRPAPVRDALVAGLEDWWLVARDRDAAAHDWLGALLQSVDADPWRVQLRAAVEQRNWQLLEELAAKDEAAGQPPETVTALALALIQRRACDAAVALLRPAQQRFPGDFWINLELGQALFLRKAPDYAEALRFYSIAGALRPGPSAAYEANLAGLLIQREDWGGAVLAARKALDLQPGFAEPYNQLGIGLDHQGHGEQAEAAYRKALERKPGLAAARFNLGLLLEHRGEGDQAVAEFERAVQDAPNDAEVREALGHARAGRKEWDAALAEFDKAIDLKPGYAEAHGERGQVLMDTGRLDDAVAELERAIRLDPTMDAAYDALGLAYRRQRRFDRAVAASSRAVELNPRSALHQYNLGNVLRAASDLTGSVAAYREAVRLDPSHAEAHCNLGLTLKEQGVFAEALAEIKEGDRLGSAQPGWRYPSGQWLKQAQRLADLDAKLPAILDGTEKPAAVREQLEYASVCRQKSLYEASAGLYAGAFDAEPALATSPEAGRRYQAACVAALAGCGQGRDAAELDAAERARWRKQALDWLRADLALWADRSDSPSAAATALQRWRGESDLAGIREPEEVAKLPESERADCLLFWSDVGDVLVRRLSNPPGK